MSQRFCRVNVFMKDDEEAFNLIKEMIEDLGLTDKGKLRKYSNGAKYSYRNLEICSVKPSEYSRDAKGYFAIYKKEDMYSEVLDHIVIPSIAYCKNIYVDENFNKTSEYDITSWRDHMFEIEDNFAPMYDIIKKFKFNVEPSKKEKK